MEILDKINKNPVKTGSAIFNSVDDVKDFIK